jgi:alpha-methylacyl-CoA racemase
MLLADLGASVLRLERGLDDAAPEAHYDILNRSRPSVAVDLKSPAGVELVRRAVIDADAVIEGFRPGVTERLGVGPEDIWAVNPRVVYGRMTGWGQTGPLASRAGHDINYIALSGALWSIGRAGERPVPPLNLVGDFGGGGLVMAFGILAGILSARATGHGQVIDAAMVDGSASLMAMTYSFMGAGYWHEERGTNILDTGAPFYDVYETADARYVAVGAIEPQFYAELLDGLGLRVDDLPRQMDRDSWPHVRELFAQCFLTKSRDEWDDIFRDRDACVTPVLSPSEAVRHPHNVSRGTFVTQPVAQPAPIPRFSKTPGEISSPPRSPGSATTSGLLEWGLGEDEIHDFRSRGAFGARP